MKISLKAALSALSLGAMTLTSVPALAQSREHRENAREYRKDVREARRDYRKDNREARRDYRKDVREARRDWRDDRRHDNGRHNGWRRPGKVVYSYDWNRPDRRYGSRYRADRYYRSGYEPIRVNRSTRIYRGYDDRYYCRRSDGTTGLIVGAALGGLLGGQLDRGYSNTAGILIGAGAGALLGREIDRGSLSCR